MTVTRYYVTSDAMGSVTAILDGDGIIRERRCYEAFGEMNCIQPDGTSVEASPTGVDVGFQGQARDDITGLYQMGYRWFNSLLGRWISQDPLGSVAYPNLYNSFNNVPTLFTDYEGLMIDCPPAPEDLHKERITESTSESIKKAVGAHRAFFYQKITIAKKASINATGLIDVGNWSYQTAIYLNSDSVSSEIISHEMVHVRDSFELISELIKSLNKFNGLPCNKKTCVDLLNALQVESIMHYQLRFQRKSAVYHLKVYDYRDLIDYEYTNPLLPGDVKLTAAPLRYSYTSAKTDGRRKLEGDAQYAERLRKDFSEKNLPIIDEAIKRSKGRVDRLIKELESCMSTGR